MRDRGLNELPKKEGVLVRVQGSLGKMMRARFYAHPWATANLTERQPLSGFDGDEDTGWHDPSFEKKRSTNGITLDLAMMTYLWEHQ